MHARELVQRLVEGGLQIKSKTPLTSVATSLKRDKRFRKVGLISSRLARRSWNERCEVHRLRQKDPVFRREVRVLATKKAAKKKKK
jgi:hypothetical protein